MELIIQSLPDHCYLRQGQHYTPIGTDLRVGFFKGEDYEGGKPFKIALHPGLQTETCVGLDIDEAESVAKFILEICSKLRKPTLLR